MKAMRLIPVVVLVPLLATAVSMIATVWPASAPPDHHQLVVQSWQPDSFDPQRANSAQDIAITRMLWRGLYQLEATEDGGAQAVPAMAAGQPTVNGSVYTVILKPGIMWSDGQPLTAMDFEYGIKRSCDPDVATPYQYLLGGSGLNIVGCDAYFSGHGSRDDVGVTATNATTLEITLEEPKATFATIMSQWVAFPARQDVIETWGNDWTAPDHIVVNGPFTLTGLTPGAGGQAVLEPNSNWALQPEPALHRITIRFINDLEAAFQAFRDGDLDMAAVPASQIDAIRADPTLNKDFLQVGSPRIWAVEMQMQDPVLNNFNVRLALSRAIDREALNDAVYNGLYLPACYWLVEGLPGFQGNEMCDDVIGYNPVAAQTALAAAGYPNGQGFPTLTLTVLNREDRIAEGQFLQAAWNNILGINVDIQAVDAQTRSQIFNSENFDLFMGGWQNDYPDPENSLIGLFDAVGANNHYNCSDPAIDAKLSAAATETDNATRIGLLQDAETLIVNGLCGVAPVYQTASLYLAKSEIEGVRPNGVLDAGMPGNWCPECWSIPDAVVTVGSRSVPPNTTVTTPLDALNITGVGLSAVTVDVRYDRALIDAVDCNPDPNHNFDSVVCNMNLASDVVRITAIRSACGLTGNVRLADLTFKALGQHGQVSPLDVSVVTFSDCNGVDIPVWPEEGAITIGFSGDVNCSGGVDAVDCLFILQHVVGMRACTDMCPLPGSPPSLYCPAADTQCDADIDAVDALFCLQNVVGMRPVLCPAGPLEVGTLFDYTGSLAALGPPIRNGADLAAGHVNNAGGVMGHDIQLLHRDSGSSAETGLNEARILADVDGVPAVVGSLSSGVTLPIAEDVTIPERVVLFSPASTSSALTALEDDDYVFRTVMSDASQGLVLANLAQQQGFGSAATLYVNNVYGQGISDAFKVSFEGLGGEVTATVPHQESQATCQDDLAVAVADDPDVLVVIMYPEDAIVCLGEATSGGLIDSFLLSDGIRSQDVLDALGGALEGTYGTAPSAMDTEGAMIFATEYEAEYGVPPPFSYVNTAYDAVVLLALAAQKAASTSGTAIRDALRDVANPPGTTVGPGGAGIEQALELVRLGQDVNYEGASGPVDLDENGDVTCGAVEVWQVQGGGFVTVRKDLVGCGP